MSLRVEGSVPMLLSCHHEENDGQLLGKAQLTGYPCDDKYDILAVMGE